MNTVEATNLLKEAPALVERAIRRGWIRPQGVSPAGQSLEAFLAARTPGATLGRDVPRRGRISAIYPSRP